MKPRPFGDPFKDAVGHYLKTNNLKSLGQINGEILADFAQKYYEHHEAQKKQRKKKGDATPEEIHIYESFPRLVERPKALSAIRKALQGVSAEELLGKVRLYRLCVSKWPSGYRYKEGRDTCPYPATWFNGERWLEDQKEWLPAGMFAREDDQGGAGPERTGSSGSVPLLLLEPAEGWQEKVRSHDSLGIFVGRDWNTINDHYKRQIIQLK